MKLSEELQWRGFVNQTTLRDINGLNKNKFKFYFGVDPSAPSMTIGNLATAMMVRHFIINGHSAVLLVGGATGMIGDPDGKSEERTLKTEQEIAQNKKNITSQYEQIFDGLDFTLVDNYDWFKDINYLEFLRAIGKNVPMRQMLGRDFVQTRLSENGAGISYAEFSYVLIQAYDFLHLSRNHGVSLQLCGSDQWGNSIAGVDLIRRLDGKEAHVWSAPLVINMTTGKKFGKTEEGAIWLDPEMTSPYSFYQFWLNAEDSGVEDYLKIYTLLSKDDIDRTLSDFRSDPGKRLAQRTLAYEVTKIVHGKHRADRVKKVTEAVFGGNTGPITEDDLHELVNEVQVSEYQANEDLTGVLVAAGLAASKTEARRFIAERAVYINGKQISEDKNTLDSKDFFGKYLLLRRGKNQLALIRR